MTPSRFIIGAACLLVLPACWKKAVVVPEGENMFSSSVSSSVAARTYSYQGYLRRSHVSIEMQGTHELLLPNGESVLLVSESIALDAFLDREVDVTGTVEETVVSGRKLMNVFAIEEILSSSSSSESSSFSSSSSSSESSSESSAAVSSAVAVSSKAAVRSSAASSKSSVATATASSSSAASGSADMEARTKKMSKQKDMTSWTQQYCSSHIGVCFPVRGDWWYRSFQTSTDYLWHVELSTEEIQNLGDGPLVVNLVSGRLEAGQPDQGVLVTDGKVVGYRSWTNNRHFEVEGSVDLQPAIEYIIKNIVPYEPEGQ